MEVFSFFIYWRKEDSIKKSMKKQQQNRTSPGRGCCESKFRGESDNETNGEKWVGMAAGIGDRYDIADRMRK